MTDWPDETAALGERFFKELADNAPVMIWRSRPDSLCDWFNKPWLDFVGRTMEQELGNGWTENVHSEDFDRCLNVYLTAFEARQPFTMVYRLRRFDGVYREILDNGAPFFRDGVFAGYFGSCIDVTDQRAAETQLRQAQKLEALGEMSAGVAHDFGNTLVSLKIALDLVAKKRDDPIETAELLAEAGRVIERGMALTKRLLAFAGKAPQSVRQVDLNQVLRTAEPLLRHSLAPVADLKYELAPDLWPVECDPIELELALLNLAVNARDATPTHGTVTVRTRNQKVSGSNREQLPPGDYVVLTMQDTGTGIDPAIIDKVLEPFFTTKGPGRGTGLGLSLVQNFLKPLGGHLRIDSQAGAGAQAHLFFRRASAPGKADALSYPEGVRSDRSGRVGSERPLSGGPRKQVSERKPLPS